MQWFFRTNLLSKTENLETIVSSLLTSCSIKKNYIPSSPIRMHWHFDAPLSPPKCEPNNNWMAHWEKLNFILNMNYQLRAHQLKVNNKDNGIGSSMDFVLVLILVDIGQVFVRWLKTWSFYLVDCDNVFATSLHSKNVAVHTTISILLSAQQELWMTNFEILDWHG